MQISSDFIDYYDHWFDQNGEVFSRRMTDGLTRKGQFEYMASCGIKVIPHGSLEHLFNLPYWEEEKKWIDEAVLYEFDAHCGKGKSLVRQSYVKWDGCLSRETLFNERMKQFGSAYLRTNGTDYFSCSLRHLQIGPHEFWIEYRSKDDWRSNCGEGSCEVVGYTLNKGFHPTIKKPLWAIDYVYGRHAWAVDFNVSPGVFGTGVEKILSGMQVADSIKEGIRCLENFTS